MSSSDEEAASPELGGIGATEPVSAMPEYDSESDDDNEKVGKKKRTVKKDQRKRESVAMFKKGEEAVHDPEEIKHLIQKSVLRQHSRAVLSGRCASLGQS
jgi:hypothetical protein